MFVHGRANGNSACENGNGQMLTRQKSTTFNRSPKTVTDDYVGDLYTLA